MFYPDLFTSNTTSAKAYSGEETLSVGSLGVAVVLVDSVCLRKFLVRDGSMRQPKLNHKLLLLIYRNSRRLPGTLLPMQEGPLAQQGYVPQSFGSLPGT